MNVLVDMPVHSPSLALLSSFTGVYVKVIEKPEEISRQLPIDLIRDCNVLFCTFLPENHEEMKALKMIQIASSGYNQLIGKRLPERGISACNALGVFDVPIAEWNISMMINLARDVRGMLHNQDHKIWDRSAGFQREIRGSVVGIWGYGGIGRETARLAKAMGMEVHVLCRNGITPRNEIYHVRHTGDIPGRLPDKVFLSGEKKQFLKGLDFLILSMPQRIENAGLIGDEELQLLPSHAFLLNPARGLLVQESSLIKALNERWIAGAALDAHYYYPMPPDHPLWTMDNVIITPHISGSSSGTKFLERVWDIFNQNVNNLMHGKRLLNELTYDQLSS